MGARIFEASGFTGGASLVIKLLGIYILINQPKHDALQEVADYKFTIHVRVPPSFPMWKENG